MAGGAWLPQSLQKRINNGTDSKGTTATRTENVTRLGYKLWASSSCFLYRNKCQLPCWSLRYAWIYLSIRSSMKEHLFKGGIGLNVFLSRVAIIHERCLFKGTRYMYAMYCRRTIYISSNELLYFLSPIDKKLSTSLFCKKDIFPNVGWRFQRWWCCRRNAGKPRRSLSYWSGQPWLAFEDFFVRHYICNSM